MDVSAMCIVLKMLYTKLYIFKNVFISYRAEKVINVIYGNLTMDIHWKPVQVYTLKIVIFYIDSL